MAEGSLEKGYILDPQAKMQSRIDEQSELICILKKRADQLLHESKSAENRVRFWGCPFNLFSDETWHGVRRG